MRALSGPSRIREKSSTSSSTRLLSLGPRPSRRDPVRECGGCVIGRRIDRPRTEGGDAMTEATSPLTHVHRLVLSEQVHSRVHGTGPMGRFNAAVAVRITKIVGTMYCAYVFTLVALVALPAAIQQGSVTVLVNWLSSNFLQLVLLPIIIVGQNVISAAQDAPAEADHETLMVLHKMSVQQIQILNGQNEILDLLRKKAG